MIKDIIIDSHQNNGGAMVELADWKCTRGSVMEHQPTGMRFFMLWMPDTGESCIEVNTMAYKPTAVEVERLKQEAAYAFERIEITAVFKVPNDFKEQGPKFNEDYSHE